MIAVVTGTISSGTDSSGSANVFGSGTNLAGLPFTYTLTYVTGVGTSSTGYCGSIPVTSTVLNSGNANPGVAWMSIGSAGKFFQVGGGDGESSMSSCATQTAAYCGGSSRIGYCMQAGYGNGFYGTTTIGGAYPGTMAYPVSGVLTTTADWTQPITSTPLDNTKLSPFSINQEITGSSGTTPYQVAWGYFAPSNLTVINKPLNQNAETNGNPRNMSGSSIHVQTTEISGRAYYLGGCGVAFQPADGNCTNNFGQLWAPLPTIVQKGFNSDDAAADSNKPTGPTDQLGCCGGDGSPDKNGGASVAEPINVATGNMYQQVTDYRTAGQNPLTFIRSYNSKGGNITVNGVPVTTLATTLGANWRSEYDAYLQLVYTGTTLTGVNAERASGQVIPFLLVGSAWVCDPDFDVTLTQSGSNWTLSDRNDTVETYTNVGTSYAQLTSTTLRNGYARTLSYSGTQLSTVTDTYGRSLSLTYSGGLLQSVATPDSTTITYGYGTAGSSNVLTSVSYPTTPATGFTYQYTDATNPLSITNILDGAGQTYASWTYDSQNRATSNKMGGTLGANAVTLTYNSDGSVTVTNALGVADTYYFTYLFGVPKVSRISRAATSTTAAATRIFGYDHNGFMSSASDWNGNVTTYTNNSLGLPTTIAEAVGWSMGRTTTISYDTTFPRLPHQIVTAGVTSTFAYDSSGNLLSETDVDTTTTSTPYSTNGQTRTYQWTYNATGETLSVQQPRTDVTAKTTLTYNTDGSLATITDAVGNQTQITSYSGGGYPLTIVDPNSVTTTLTWDGGQRPITSSIHTGAGNLTTTVTFDSAGNVATVQKPDGSQFSFSYDAAHRLTTITDLFGNTVNYTLDALGDATQVQVKNASAVVTASHTATFDALGRMLTYVGGMSQTTTLTWDKQGNLLTAKDPLLNTTTMTYDHLNRLATSVDPSPGGTTTITYDTHDRVLSVKSPINYTTSYVYDGFGDRIQVASPDSGTAVYTYNADGDLTKQVLPGSLETDLTFDADDRMLTASYPSDSTLDTTLTYDQTGHGFGLGRLTSSTDKIGSLSLTYDERGHVTAESRVATGITTMNTSYAFDTGNNLSSITYPSGTVVAYARDSMGRVTSVTAQPPGFGSPSNVATSIAYEPFGPVTGLSYGNGITGTYAYDNDYRPTSRVDSATSSVMNLAYTFDANDNVKTITDSVNAANGQTLGYDVLNRLTSAASGTGGYGSWSWTWDKGHNVNTQVIAGTTTTFRFVSSTDKIWWWNQGSTTPTLAYTAAGNINTLTVGSTVTTTLNYNAANEMSSASASGGSASYAYDLFGRRLEKTPSGGNTILFQYAGVSTLLSENDGHSNQADYIYLRGRPIGEVNPATGSLYYTHTDLLGTPQDVTNASATVVWSATYRPFGDTQTTAGSIVQHLRYPGQYYDSETGYNHNGFRDSIPSLTRYAEADPIGLAGGINPFEYAAGNPFKAIDPSGLACYSVGGTTTCQPPGGPLVQFPTPPGWPATLDSSSSNYHSYNIAVDFTGNCSGALSQAMINNPTPGPSNSPATPQGTANDATPSTLSWFGPSPVMSYAAPGPNGTSIVINVTQPGHPLFPGYVVRTITSYADGDTSVNNYGEGAGWLQGPYSPLRGFINDTWIGQTHSLAGCGCNSK